MIRHLLLVLCLWVPARADVATDLQQIEASLDNLDYAAAESQITRLLDTGGLRATDLVRAYRLAGEIAAVRGRSAAARDAFVRYLLLEPSATMSADVSPRITEPFELAKAEVRRIGPLGIDAVPTRTAAAVKVELVLRDPLGWVTGMRVGLGGKPPIPVQGTVATIASADAPRVTIELAAVDAKGNELRRFTFVAPPVTPRLETPVVQVTRRHRVPRPLRWPVWSGLAVGAAGVGGYFAYRLQRDEDRLSEMNASAFGRPLDEARALAAAADRHADAANLAFIVAGGLALAGVITFFIDTEIIDVVPAPAGSTGAGVALRF